MRSDGGQTAGAGGGAHGAPQVRGGAGGPRLLAPPPALAELHLMDSAFRNPFLYFPGSGPPCLPGVGLVTSSGIEA